MVHQATITTCAVLFAFSLFSWWFWHFTWKGMKRIGRDVYSVIPKRNNINRAAKALAKLTDIERQQLINIIKE